VTLTTSDRAPASAPSADRSEQSRARYPDRSGVLQRDGGRVAYEVYGSGDPPIVFVPPWQIVHSRIWKAQIPDFARRHRVVAWDNRGNGRSDRPTDPAAHSSLARADNLRAVMDITGVEAGVLVGLSSASGPMVIVASDHPERVAGLVFIAPAAPLGEPGRMAEIRFEERLDTDERWAKENIHYWRRDYRGFLEYFFSQAFPEPHSTKQLEDGVAWGLDTDPQSLAATKRAPVVLDAESFAARCAAIRAPTLVIQGSDERLSHRTQGIAVAEAIPGAQLELLEGSGHMPNLRDPVRVNLLIRDFIARLGPPT
jgi:pimeloyl-ACP methyl ester carboxylesterase